MERIAFWRKELQGRVSTMGAPKTGSVGYVQHCKPTVAHRFQRRVRGVCVRVAGGYLPTRRPRAKDSNTDTTSRRHNAVRARLVQKARDGSASPKQGEVVRSIPNVSEKSSCGCFTSLRFVQHDTAMSFRAQRGIQCMDASLRSA